MNNQVFVCGLVAALALGSFAEAQDPPPPAPTVQAGVRVGIINIQRAIVESTEGKKAAEDLTKRFTPKRSDLEKKREELAKLQKQLEDGKNTLSDEARANLIREIERKTKDFNRDNEDANSDFQQAEAQLINTIGTKVMRVLDEYARKNGYDVILDISAQQSNVLWATNRIDITDEIIGAFNLSGGAAAPTAPPAGGAAPPGGAVAPAVRPPATKPPATKPSAPPR